MNRITFQFIPSSRGSISIHLNKNKNDIAEVSASSNGFKTLYLKQGGRIEIFPNGTIRYTFESGRLDDISLTERYDALRSILEDIVTDTLRKYTVVLLLNNNCPNKMYQDMIDEIRNMGKKDFQSSYPNYTELNENTVKISFRDANSEIYIP